MAQGLYPKDELMKWLPDDMAIPDDSIMEEKYGATQVDGQHPFMLSFCHGRNIHDKFTKKNVPEQEELMFVFPVIYTGSDGKQTLMSYTPVLYLNSSMGVVGGLYYGLRKEWHPNMKIDIPDDHSKSWNIKNTIDASFVQIDPSEDIESLPQFMHQTFENPFVSISYPPFAQPYFYTCGLYANKVVMSSGTFEWDYKKSNIVSIEDTQMVYAEYWFWMSSPMSYEQITSK